MFKYIVSLLLSESLRCHCLNMTLLLFCDAKEKCAENCNLSYYPIELLKLIKFCHSTKRGENMEKIDRNKIYFVHKVFI